MLTYLEREMIITAVKIELQRLTEARDTFPDSVGTYSITDRIDAYVKLLPKLDDVPVKD